MFINHFNFEHVYNKFSHLGITNHVKSYVHFLNTNLRQSFIEMSWTVGDTCTTILEFYLIINV
jgi:hypothetical protein